MRSQCKNRILRGLGLLLAVLLLAGCGGSPGGPGPGKPDSGGTDEPVQGSWESTPQVIALPETEEEIIGDEDGIVQIDISHVEDGIIQVSYNGENEKPLLCVTVPDGETRYQYVLSAQQKKENFPLTRGSGTYTVKVYEQLEGEDYAVLFAAELPAEITNEMGPFLYANYYCRFNDRTAAVKKGGELAFTANSELDVVQNVYNFVISHVEYDYDKAETVQYGYVPNVDDTLASGKGICFDYAALMVSMLRSQGIPTRLDVGYMRDIYHAWISVYVPEQGWINGVIQFDGKKWNMMDPTSGAALGKDVNAVGSGEDYLCQLSY